MRRLAIIVSFVVLLILAGWRLGRLGDAEQSNQRPSPIARSVAGVLNHMNLATDWARDVLLRETVWQLTDSLENSQDGSGTIGWKDSGADGCRELRP
jgi:hypothetical protein